MSRIRLVTVLSLALVLVVVISFMMTGSMSAADSANEDPPGKERWELHLLTEQNRLDGRYKGGNPVYSFPSIEGMSVKEFVEGNLFKEAMMQGVRILFENSPGINNAPAGQIVRVTSFFRSGDIAVVVVSPGPPQN